MKDSMNAIQRLPHPEERPTGASRRTQPTEAAGLADAVFPGPAEAGEGVALRPVFAADPALVADLVEQIEQIGVMDFADIGLVPPRIAGDLASRVVPGARRPLGP